MPFPATKGVAIRSGSLVLDGALVLSVTAVSRESLYARIVELGRGRSHRLLESFASVVADVLLEEFPVERVTLSIRKETPVLDGIVDSVGVRISRARA